MTVLPPWVKPSWIQDAHGNLYPYEQTLEITSQDSSVTLTYTDQDGTDPAGVGATQIDLSASGGGGGSLEVTDGTTTVNPTTEIDFTSGLTVTGGDGKAKVAPSYRPTKIVSFDFAYDTEGLTGGVDIGYTPQVGELLLDCWFDISESWDGTTPQGDVGTFATSGGYGFFAASHYPINMSFSGTDINGTDGLRVLQQAADGLAQSAVRSVLENLIPNGATLGWGPNSESPSAFLTAPAIFTAANPLLVVVSQSGLQGGADPVSTVGAATLYLLLSPPA